MKLKFSLSGLLCVLLFTTLICTQFIDAPWKRAEGVIKSDVKGYYAYLPALFINNDLKLDDVSVYENGNGYKIWFKNSPDGVRFIKYSIGTAAMYAPFFGLAHVYAGLTGYEQDGFSVPYSFALSFSSLFYLLFGMLFLRKALLFYFSETVVTITLLILFCGTNLFNYATFDACYSHAYSFSLISGFIYFTLQWLKTEKVKFAIGCGLVFGMFVLIRPIDVVFILFPLLIHVRTWSGFKERIAFIWRNKRGVILFILMMIVCFIPQFIYFKIISNNWLFYSYTDEKFFFGNPNWINAIFSFRNGWLIYSPLMVFALVGFFTLRKQISGWLLPLTVIFVLYVFVISSWWCWWYVGFGNRAFINLYPFLSFTLAGFIAFLWKKRWWLKIVFSIVLLTGISLSIFQTFQYSRGVIHWGYMSKKAYTDSFLRWNATPLFETHLEIPNARKALLGISDIFHRETDTISVRRINFEELSKVDSTYHQFIDQKFPFKGKRALFLPDWVEYQLNEKIVVKDANRIFISAWINDPEEFNLCLSSNKFNFSSLSGNVVDQRKGWSRIEMYSVIPDECKNDTLQFFVWKRNRNNAYLDNVQIVLTNERLVE